MLLRDGQNTSIWPRRPITFSLLSHSAQKIKNIF
uniref:Uncharacterized protein n=1 Tax=Rhizophora mucronata TaxID=61149 RepID=A0A2P2NCN3_RHIMU